MSFTVVFTPEAQDQLVELYRYIADAASSEGHEPYPCVFGNFCHCSLALLYGHDEHLAPRFA
ncbi:hypothetical protein LRC484719_02300 [Mycobacterium riyadhense]